VNHLFNKVDETSLEKKCWELKILINRQHLEPNILTN